MTLRLGCFLSLTVSRSTVAFAETGRAQHPQSIVRPRSFDPIALSARARQVPTAFYMCASKSLISEARLVSLAVIPVVAASLIGQIATYPNLTPWYAGLLKPSFNPPNWVFAPVWTALYVLMAFSVWRMLRLRRNAPARRLGLTLFFVQLALNAAWPWMFFAAHNPALGLTNIIPQLAIITATVIAFLRLDVAAAVALMPLGAWVAFAAVLNFSIWSMNG
jgi:translocator protein